MFFYLLLFFCLKIKKSFKNEFINRDVALALQSYRCFQVSNVDTELQLESSLNIPTHFFLSTVESNMVQ